MIGICECAIAHEALERNAVTENVSTTDDILPYEPVSSSAVRLFRLAWQLENWLRTIVYVELRASRKDWEDAIKKCVSNSNKVWPPLHLSRDKSLHHMKTHHEGALSYLTFGELWNLISGNDNWPLFEQYFPPRDNVFARIEEIKTIRNRVAHFRTPQRHDEDRFKLFMQDMQSGIRIFCTRYTTSKRPKNDPVVDILANCWEEVGYGYEVSLPDGQWLYAPGSHRMDPLMHGTIEFLTSTKYKNDSTAGVIYKLKPNCKGRERLNISNLLSSTKDLHADVIHIIVISASEIAITIPAILGNQYVARLISAFLSAGLNSSRSPEYTCLADSQDEWPEYVLYPSSLLSFFDSDIRDPILDIS